MAQTHGEWVKSGCNTVISHNLNNLSLWFYLWLRSRLGDWRVERMRRWMSRWQWEHWPSVGSEAREAPTNAWEPTSWLEILPCALTSQSQKCLWVEVGKDSQQHTNVGSQGLIVRYVGVNECNIPIQNVEIDFLTLSHTTMRCDANINMS